jgi:hypothetical protein
METRDLNKLKLEIQLEAKKGVDFITAASIVWAGFFFIWTLEYSSYSKSVLTFMAGSIMIPLAFGLSKAFKTNWKIKDNPLQPLGIWLNFAQLIYFPFLVFILIKYPDYFIMTYAIITGAHLFPYAWFYDEIGYAVAAILISVGALLISLLTASEMVFMIPIFTAASLALLSLWISVRNKKLRKKALAFG